MFPKGAHNSGVVRKLFSAKIFLDATSIRHVVLIKRLTLLWYHTWQDMQTVTFVQEERPFSRQYAWLKCHTYNAGIQYNSKKAKLLQSQQKTAVPRWGYSRGGQPEPWSAGMDAGFWNALSISQ